MKLKRSIKIVFSCLVLISLVGFVEKRRSTRVCSHVAIEIENQYQNYFVSENDVHLLMTNTGAEQLIGTYYSNLNLKQLEKRIEAHKYVKKANVYKDLEGNLIVEAFQNRPIARILQTDAPDAYISTDGEILPVSDRYTARVTLVSGPYTKKLVGQNLQEEKSRQIFDLIKYIEGDEFWKAQIAQIDVQADGEVILYPQLGKQQIEFGKAENIPEKFFKLHVFYKQILPRKGWRSYQKVNLKYENQIVCD